MRHLFSFEVQQASGAPHAPSFTVVCQLASVKRQAKFSTKKGAKQLAAKLMLDIIQTFQREDDQKQLAKLNKFVPEPVEKVIQTYRELKKSDIKPTVVRFDQRHNYFMRLSPEQRAEVYNILTGSDTPRNMVDLVCKEIKEPYIVDNVPDHPANLTRFILTGNYDCVFTGKDYLIWEEFVDYFKIMFHIKYIL